MCVCVLDCDGWIGGLLIVRLNVRTDSCQKMGGN